MVDELVKTETKGQATMELLSLKEIAEGDEAWN
jgi:hypothetical protein